MELDLSNINPGVAIGIVVFTLIGVVEWAKSLWRSLSGDAAQQEKAFIIGVAALAGFLIMPVFGMFVDGLTGGQLRILGILLGFNASGVVTVAFNWGKSSSKSHAALGEGPKSETETLG